MKRGLILLGLVLWSMLIGVSAVQGQTAPVAPWPGVTVPIFGIASVNGSAINPASVGVNASTCAAPGVYLTSAPTNGMAFTATPSVILCVNGVAILTSTASAVTSTVPYLAPDGTAGAPSYSFASQPTSIGMFVEGTNQLGFAAAGAKNFSIRNGQIVFGNSTTALLTFSTNEDTILSRESANVIQQGLNAAGVTDQLFKGPDRITSDGVGGAMYFAGGRNRGAFAGGPLIFQTSPAAGAGVTGTLATALTIDSTKLATFGSSVVTGVHFKVPDGNGLLDATGDGIRIVGTGLFQFSDAANTSGIRLNVATNGVAKFFAIDGTTNGTVQAGIFQGSGTGTSVANVGANSCGTSAATIAGNQVSGVITVGATAGTQCRVTFTTAAPVARDCTVTDSTTTIATRATVVDTTNTDFLGAFVAGDKVTFICMVR